MNNKQKIIISAVAVLGLFVLVSFLSQKYSSEIVSVINGGSIWGMVLYLIITILATVVAPLSSVPLVPLVSIVWGPLVSALLSILGWFIGAVIAFWLSRRYGLRIVSKFVSEERVSKINSVIPDKYAFWFLILLRMILPVDILSYALGLISKIKWSTYLVTTLVGIIPFAFVFAYAGTLDFKIQIVLGLIVISLLYYIFKSSKNSQMSRLI